MMGMHCGCVDSTNNQELFFMRDSLELELRRLSSSQKAQEFQEQQARNTASYGDDDLKYKVDMQRIYDDYNVGKISADQAIQAKKSVEDWHRKYMRNHQHPQIQKNVHFENELMDIQNPTRLYRFSDLSTSSDIASLLNRGMMHNSSSGMLLSRSVYASPGVNNTDMEQQNRRQKIYTDELSLKHGKQFYKISQTDEVYRKFKLALKDDDKETRKLRFQQEREDEYQEFRKQERENEDLDIDSHREWKEDASKVTLNIKKFERAPLDMAKQGFFFLEQPVKDGVTFYFHPYLVTKIDVLTYLQQELTICQNTLYNMISTKRSTIKRRREKELKNLKDLIKGISSGEARGESGLLGMHVKMKQEEQELPRHEFVLILDMVRGLDETSEKVRVKYGFFRQGFPHEANRTTNEHFSDTDGVRAYIKELDTTSFGDYKTDHYIYFQLLLFHEKVKMPESVGWSIHRIFNKDKYIQLGQFCVPLYDHRLEIDSVMKDYQKPLGKIQVCFTIARLDPEKEESPFKTPEYYKDGNYTLPEMHKEDREDEDVIQQKKEFGISKSLKAQAHRPQLLYEEAFREKPIPFLAITPGSSKPVSRASSEKSQTSLSQQQYQQQQQIGGGGNVTQEEYEQYQQMLETYDQPPVELVFGNNQKELNSINNINSGYTYDQSTRLP